MNLKIGEKTVLLNFYVTHGENYNWEPFFSLGQPFYKFFIIFEWQMPKMDRKCKNMLKWESSPSRGSRRDWKSFLVLFRRLSILSVLPVLIFPVVIWPHLIISCVLSERQPNMIRKYTFWSLTLELISRGNHYPFSANFEHK